MLYADDDADDRAWISEACQAFYTRLELCFVENGREVFDCLEPLAQDELPSLIILDLNMPKMDGRRTLQLLKADPRYKHIPVAIVSTSSSKIDQEVCMRLGASLFLVKPSAHKNWTTIAEQLAPLVL